MGFLQYELWGNTLGRYAIFLGILVLSFIAGKIVYWLFSNILTALTKKTETKLDDILVEALNSPIVFFVMYGGFHIAYRTLVLGARALTVFGNISFILLMIGITWTVINVIDGLIKEYFTRPNEEGTVDMNTQILPVIRTLVRVVLIIIGILVVLSNMGFDIASILAGLGIGGLAFALAAQDTLKNFFGGVAVFADKPFKVGDRIKLDDARDGFVKEVGMRSTKIETFDGTFIIIPNAKIADSILENVSKEKARRVKMVLGLEYDTSNEKIERAIEIIKTVVKKHKNTGKDNMSVTFDKFGDDALELLVIYWITDIPKTLAIKNDINLEIKKKFEKEKINFAFHTQTVHLKK